MRSEPAELLRDALSLPAEARAALIDSLLESLDTDPSEIEPDANAQQAWREEIHRRLQEIDNGSVRMVPWSEARGSLRSKLPR